MKNTMSTIIENNYKEQFLKMEEKIDNNIEILGNDASSEYDKENAQRELEWYFGRITDWKRAFFWSATKYWIDFLLSPLKDIYLLNLSEIKQIEKLKSLELSKQFPIYEKEFDRLDEKILKSLKTIGSKFIISQNKIKQKSGYYGKIISK